MMPTIIVLVGISGDLAGRKLLPALARLEAAGQLPEHFCLVGTTRQALQPDDILSHLDPALTEADRTFLQDHIDVLRIDMSTAEAYSQLAEHLRSIETRFGQPAQRLFYLSVPPEVSSPIIAHLGDSGLNQVANTRLLIEKPFGTDLATAEALVQHVDRYFAIDQVYRVDHYVAKHMAQNIVPLRQSRLLAAGWNRENIERIDIIASESIGIEGRANFYEQTGALRDLVQSHLLQLAALVLMEIPDQPNDVAGQRLAALQSLRVPDVQAVQRGQYQGYRQEVSSPQSKVETFVSLPLESTDARWQGVPIVLSTGKSLRDKLTEIRVHYRSTGSTKPPEQLVLSFQPQESIGASVSVLRPDITGQSDSAQLVFAYGKPAPDAYEYVFARAMEGDHSLFPGAHEVLASWRIVAPVQAYWQAADDPQQYAIGTSINDLIS